MTVFRDLSTFVRCDLCGNLVPSDPDSKVAHLVTSHGFPEDDARAEVTTPSSVTTETSSSSVPSSADPTNPGDAGPSGGGS